MTRELIIEGERMDLAPDTSITLEYVSNMLSDPGKISLSHSYTIKLPRTTRNAKILDVPEIPGHVSQRTRRYLSARFIQNGVDLIGPAQAYILQTTPDAYEIALVWNTLEALQALSESDATVNDLPDLPELWWIDDETKRPDYSTAYMNNDAFFALYNSGLGGLTVDEVSAATHPCMRFDALLRRILDAAGVSYTLTQQAQAAIGNKVVLAAPGRKPNAAQERGSGNIASAVYANEVIWDDEIPTANRYPAQYIGITMLSKGWDKVGGGTIGSGSSQSWPYAGQLWETTDVDHHVLVNIKAPAGVDLSGVTLDIYAYGEYNNDTYDRERLLLTSRAFAQDENGAWYMFINEDIKVSGWKYYGLNLITPNVLTFDFLRYDNDLPIMAINKAHEVIDPTKDNHFPLQGNLPDLRQWDFVKALMTLCGIAPTIRSGVLQLSTYSELLDRTDAYDWTHKVDMTDGGPEVLKYALDGWTQHNDITFAENTSVQYDPTARLVVDDLTLKESREWFSLPFAASKLNTAEHYSLKTASAGKSEAESIDIEPRFFNAEEARPIFSKGQAWLYFNDDMYGAGLIEAHYEKLQAIVRKPVMLTANIRLNEVDLAKLDLTRPVYLGQFGQYYGILKIQTGTDLCKVELIQLT